MGVSPHGLTCAELFTMATARHRAQRVWMYQQSALVNDAVCGKSRSQFAIDEFIRCGVMGGDGPKIPDPPEVKEIIARIHRDGKLIID